MTENEIVAAAIDPEAYAMLPEGMIEWAQEKVRDAVRMAVRECAKLAGAGKCWAEREHAEKIRARFPEAFEVDARPGAVLEE
ncbi:MAG: hypothetical protein GY820_39425 [Gammaproteobacteria bacterium]|nr:hypothetical protein [Gammaproteobacteria bacterium]